MSTLNVANVTDGTTSVPTGYVVNGTPKCWINVNQTSTQAIRDSLNIASITDGGTGITTATLTNAMSDANFAMAGSMSTSRYNYSVSVLTTSTFKMNVRNDAATFVDNDQVSGISYGDLA